MTRLSSLACTTAAMLLTFGIAMAADQAEAEQTKPAVTDNPEKPVQPKEEAARTTNSSPSTPAKEEPDCN